MTNDRWLDTKATIQEKFEILEEGKEELDENEGKGHREFVIFNGPLGKMKAENTVKAIVLDKKILSSRRAGAQSKVEYVYSDTEKSNKFKAYKWDEGSEEWVEITIEGL